MRLELCANSGAKGESSGAIRGCLMKNNESDKNGRSHARQEKQEQDKSKTREASKKARREASASSSSSIGSPAGKCALVRLSLLARRVLELELEEEDENEGEEEEKSLVLSCKSSFRLLLSCLQTHRSIVAGQASLAFCFCCDDDDEEEASISFNGDYLASRELCAI